MYSYQPAGGSRSWRLEGVPEWVEGDFEGFQLVMGDQDFPQADPASR